MCLLTVSFTRMSTLRGQNWIYVKALAAAWGGHKESNVCTLVEGVQVPIPPVFPLHLHFKEDIQKSYSLSQDPVQKIFLGKWDLNNAMKF